MKPTLEKLYDMNVRVREEPLWSGHFEITVRFDDADQHAQAKAGLIAALQRQEQEKKVEEVLDKVEKTLTKEEKREIKRRRQEQNRKKKFVNCQNFEISIWMSELNVKPEDIDTPEKKQAVIEKLMSNSDSEKEAQKKEFLEKVNALVEELKKLGAEVEMKE